MRIPLSAICWTLLLPGIVLGQHDAHRNAVREIARPGGGTFGACGGRAWQCVDGSGRTS